MKKIFLVGQENIGSAIDDDFRFTKSALSSFAKIVDNLAEAEVIHAVNWNALLPLDKTVLKNKIVVTHIPHDVRNMLMQPEYLKVAPFIDHWIVPSKKAREFADLLGLKNSYIPYGIDLETFFPIAGKDSLREKFNLPKDKYLIGSFQRDTEGKDLKTPKYVKGPDIFLEIVKKVFETEKNIHVVLAGPRRFWLRKKLEENSIPHSFIGQKISGRDDLKENTLDHKTINELYNAIDLYIVSSRMEGGPKAVLECAAAKTKIISTDAGHALDILDINQIYTNIFEASNLILDDIATSSLEKYIPNNFKNSANNTLPNISLLLKSRYDKLNKENVDNSLFKVISIKQKTSVLSRLVNSIIKKRITIYFQFHKGPWGGGNQFLKALSNSLKKRGWWIHNSLNLSTPIFLFNSFLLDFDKMNKIDKGSSLMINRIDGPTFHIRGTDIEIDDAIFSLNKKIADVSVFQSSWSLFETLNLDYKPVNPVLISNAVNNKIFNQKNKVEFNKNRKIKIISTSWSDNPKKGGPTYKWLDENLDWNRYDYTFVGRIKEDLKNIKVINPVPSEKLAEILKQHDIYITASDNDPCSNALVEALSCGLPSIYLNRGGHSELVGFGGLPFNNKEEISELLTKITDNYRVFENLIVVNNISNIAEKYEHCFNLIKYPSR